MNFKTETVYQKAKELRELLSESNRSAFFEDTNLNKMFLKRCQQIPFQIGMSLNAYSLDEIRLHLEKADKMLREIEIVIDLTTSEYFKIDSLKLDSLLKEIRELIQITLEKAEEEEQKWRQEIMKEFMVNKEVVE